MLPLLEEVRTLCHERGPSSRGGARPREQDGADGRLVACLPARRAAGGHPVSFADDKGTDGFRGPTLVPRRLPTLGAGGGYAGSGSRGRKRAHARTGWGAYFWGRSGHMMKVDVRVWT